MAFMYKKNPYLQCFSKVGKGIINYSNKKLWVTNHNSDQGRGRTCIQTLGDVLSYNFNSSPTHPFYKELVLYSYYSVYHFATWSICSSFRAVGIFYASYGYFLTLFDPQRMGLATFYAILPTLLLLHQVRQSGQDSNLNEQSQNLLCYRYIITHYLTITFINPKLHLTRQSRRGLLIHLSLCLGLFTYMKIRPLIKRADLTGCHRGTVNQRQ